VAASAAQRRGVVEIVIRELSKHAALEELLVYPLAKRLIPEMAEEVDEHLSEHMGMKRILAALDRLSAGDRRERDLVAELKREVDQHVQEEEGRFFPTLRETLGRQALEDLGERIRQGKHSAPTRPHPHAPNEPPALAMAAPVAAAYDRVRDRLQRRPRT
jgi:hemerythrin-like domain-containing protein